MHYQGSRHNKMWLLQYTKRLYKAQRHIVLVALFVITFSIIFGYINSKRTRLPAHRLSRKAFDIKKDGRLMHQYLIESVLKEKGLGCVLPKLDPFSEDTSTLENEPNIVCPGKNWKSECYVEKAVSKTLPNIVCTYQDVLYSSNNTMYQGDPVKVFGDDKYVLNKSDNVKISCTATDESEFDGTAYWFGFKTGFRPISLKPRRPERKESFNVLILAFESYSHNAFMRRMPKTYYYLAENSKAVILNGFTPVGDANTETLFPILTGRAETDYLDVTQSYDKEEYLDPKTSIFHQLKEEGYRTAYFELTPWINTFQNRFKSFDQHQVDHYLQKELFNYYNLLSVPRSSYCIGAIPAHQFLMDLTSEFLDLDGKKFCFTFISDIKYANLMSHADDATIDLLESIIKRNITEDTLVIVMGQHGSRFPKPWSYDGRLEEYLPLLAVFLPERLKRLHPETLEALEHNKNVLTTHFDLHATIIDMLGLEDQSFDYVVPGADYTKALSLLSQIPKSRTCGEAGILPHWCVCSKLYNVSKTNPIYEQVAQMLAVYINSICEVHRDKCVERQLIAIEWVKRQKPNEDFLMMNPSLRTVNKYYQVKIVMSPEQAVFQGILKHNVKYNNFFISENDLLRINSYEDLPASMSTRYPHLNKFCYCRNRPQQTRFLSYDEEKYHEVPKHPQV